MEYNELITKAQQASVDTPDADTILSGMHRTLRRRQQRHSLLLSLTLVALVGLSVALMQPAEERPLTLAERVSAQLAKPTSKTPPSLVGYRHSVRNHQIYTLI